MSRPIAYGVTSPEPPATGYRYRIDIEGCGGVLYRWEWVGGNAPRLYGWEPIVSGRAEDCERALMMLVTPEDTIERNGRVIRGCRT